MSVRLSVCLVHLFNNDDSFRAMLTMERTLIADFITDDEPMLSVAVLDTTSCQNVLDVNKSTSSVSRQPSEMEPWLLLSVNRKS